MHETTDTPQPDQQPDPVMLDAAKTIISVGVIAIIDNLGPLLQALGMHASPKPAE